MCFFSGGSESLAFGEPQFVRMFSSSFPKSLEPGNELQKDEIIDEGGKCVSVIQRGSQQGGRIVHGCYDEDIDKLSVRYRRKH